MVPDLQDGSVLSPVLSLGIFHCTPLSCVSTVLTASPLCLCPAAPPSPLGPYRTHWTGWPCCGCRWARVEVPGPDQADHHCAASIKLLTSPPCRTLSSSFFYPTSTRPSSLSPPPPQAKPSLLRSSSSPIDLPKCEADLSDPNLLDLGGEAVRS